MTPTQLLQHILDNSKLMTMSEFDYDMKMWHKWYNYTNNDRILYLHKYNINIPNKLSINNKYQYFYLQYKNIKYVYCSGAHDDEIVPHHNVISYKFFVVLFLLCKKAK